MHIFPISADAMIAAFEYWSVPVCICEYRINNTTEDVCSKNKPKDMKSHRRFFGLGKFRSIDAEYVAEGVLVRQVL